MIQEPEAADLEARVRRDEPPDWLIDALLDLDEADTDPEDSGVFTLGFI